MPRPEREAGGQVIEKPKPKTRKPRLFHVVLHNDDYTTMEFVVKILQTVFGKPEPEAFRIMLQVHLEGKGICGAFTYEVAETKAATVHDMAQGAGYPLRASVEEA
jgi:ATP-dependent Clp protease adaptor protein ClpS